VSEQAAPRLHQLTAELRAAFDRSFAEAEAGAPPAQLDLLQIGVAEHGYALRLSDVVSLHAERRVVPAPSPRPELLGLIGVRGAVVPVYDLRLLLGYRPGPTPRWVALLRSSAPLAIAFEHFTAHLRVEHDRLVARNPGASEQHPFAGGSVHLATGPLSLIDLPALVAGLSSTRRSGAANREVRR
jgi:chemotaxis signal transduction protein